MDSNSIPLSFLPQFRSRSKTYSSIESAVRDVHSPMRSARLPVTSRRTVFLMVSFYVFAFAIASIHAGFYFWLHSKVVDETLPQDVQTFVSNMLAIAFELSCLSCVSIAYSQRIWRLFRKIPMKAGTIDHLYTLPHNPSSLFHWTIFRKAPAEALIGLLCALLPVAITFPPSAVTIEPRQYPREPAIVTPVDTFNISDYGNASEDNIKTNALFHLDSDLNYMYPKPDIARIAKQTLMVHDALQWDNVCLKSNSTYRSPNCTYELVVKGSTAQCVQMQGKETEALSNSKRLYDGLLFEVLEPKIGANIFHIGWYPETEYKPCASGGVCPLLRPYDPAFLNCSASLAEYSMNVTFDNGNRTLVHLSNKTGEVLPGFASFYRYFRPVGDHSGLPPLEDLSYLYEQTQAIAIRDAIVEALKGDAALNNDNFRENGSLILQSRFTRTQFTGNAIKVNLNITTEGLQELFRDVSLSLVSLGRWNSNNTIFVRKHVNTYIFKPKFNIFIPYGLSLVVSLIILLLGLSALRSNGVPADDSFVQIVCATRASKALDRAAKRGCRGDSSRFSEELKGMELLLGDIVQENGGEEEAGEEGNACSAVLTGFGTLEEVRAFKRRM